MKMTIFYDPSIMGDEEAASDFAASMRWDGHDASIEVDPDYMGWPPAPASCNITNERRASIKEREREAIAARTEPQIGPRITDPRRLAQLAVEHGWKVWVNKHANGEVSYTRGSVQVNAGFSLNGDLELMMASIVGGPTFVEFTEDLAVVSSWLTAKR